jgi:ferritin-like metal-binding protein YciE
MALRSLQELYVEHIRDLYSAETQILDALPPAIEKASSQKLRDRFTRHLEQTKEHVRRLEAIARRLGEEPAGATCAGMQGLLRECADVVKEDGTPNIIDSALIAAVQSVEHHEIAAYGCARTYADALYREDDVVTLQRTLDEEAETDEALTRIAEALVNPDAHRPVGFERDVTPRPRWFEDVETRPGSDARS